MEPSGDPCIQSSVEFPVQCDRLGSQSFLANLRIGAWIRSILCLACKSNRISPSYDTFNSRVLARVDGKREARETIEFSRKVIVLLRNRCLDCDETRRAR